MEASNSSKPPLKCTIILLHAVHDDQGGRTAAIARHVSLTQITCTFKSLYTSYVLTYYGSERVLQYCS